MINYDYILQYSIWCIWKKSPGLPIFFLVLQQWPRKKGTAPWDFDRPRIKIFVPSCEVRSACRSERFFPGFQAQLSMSMIKVIQICRWWYGGFLKWRHPKLAGWFISWKILLKWMRPGGTPISGNHHISYDNIHHQYPHHCWFDIPMVAGGGPWYLINIQ